MKNTIIIVALFGLISFCISIPVTLSQAHDQFRDWMIKYDKVYETDAEFMHRFQIFKQNLDRTTEMNKKSVKPTDAKVLGTFFIFTLQFGITRFMDLTPEEFAATYLTAKPVPEDEFKAHYNPSFDAMTYSLPPSTDWRKSGCISEIKDQGQCGSCYAFGATEAIESAYCLGAGKLLTLAPQQIVSCDSSDMGCGGGWVSHALTYAKVNRMALEEDYPYTSGKTGQNGNCLLTDNIKREGTITTYDYVGSLNETAMQVALVSKTPLTVSVAAHAFQTYHGGILGNEHCDQEVNHIVQIVAYNIEDPENPYWVVRNSWGDWWGEEGYIRVKMFDDTCSISKQPMTVTYNPSQ